MKLIAKINSNWIIALLFISVTWVNLNQERWKGKDIIAHDINNYYGYLPALFYEHDLSLSFLNDTVNRQIEGRYYWPNKAPNGNHVLKMSMGMSLSYLPFFGLAHLYASTFDYPANGFSEPYHFAVLFSSLFYFLIGLFYLDKLLKLFFSESVATLSLVCICFGTNVYYYLTVGGGLSHTMGFTLISVFLYHTVLWHRNQQLKNLLLLGCLGGLLTLIRPINILIFLFFFLYDITSLQDIRLKFKLLMANKFGVCLMAMCGILIFLPQLLYWKWISGSYFFNSYVGEHFFFNNPHVLEGFFSFRKGWLIYSPIMLLSLIGFYFLKKKLNAFFLATLLFFCIYCYVVFSWWCWWYGGSFGARVLIDIYPVLAIPFAAFLSEVSTFHRLKKRIVYALIACFCLLNLFQTIQAKYNIIHYDSMTKENYWRVFFTITKQADRENYLKHPDYKKALRGEDE